MNNTLISTYFASVRFSTVAKWLVPLALLALSLFAPQLAYACGAKEGTCGG